MPIFDEFMTVLVDGLMTVVAVRCCKCLLARDWAILRMVEELEAPRPRPGDLGAVLLLPGDTLFMGGVWDAALPDEGTTLPLLLALLVLGADVLLTVVFVPEDEATLLAVLVVVVVVAVLDVVMVVVAEEEGEAMDDGGRASLLDTGTGIAAEGDEAHRGEAVDREEGVTALEAGAGALLGRVLFPGWRWGAGLLGGRWGAGLLGALCGAGLLGGRWGAGLLLGGR